MDMGYIFIQYFVIDSSIFSLADEMIIFACFLSPKKKKLAIEHFCTELFATILY